MDQVRPRPSASRRERGAGLRTLYAPQLRIQVFFAIFGSRRYAHPKMRNAVDGAALIPCRRCIGERKRPGCVACKGTGCMCIDMPG